VLCVDFVPVCVLTSSSAHVDTQGAYTPPVRKIQNIFAHDFSIIYMKNLPDRMFGL